MTSATCPDLRPLLTTPTTFQQLEAGLRTIQANNCPLSADDELLITHFTQHNNPQIRFVAFQALVHVKSPALLGVAVRNLRDTDSRMRRMALEQLSTSDQPEILYHLLQSYFLETDRDLRQKFLETVNMIYAQANDSKVPSAHEKVLLVQRFIKENDLAKNRLERLQLLKSTLQLDKKETL